MNEGCQGREEVKKGEEVKEGRKRREKGREERTGRKDKACQRRMPRKEGRGEKGKEGRKVGR